MRLLLIVATIVFAAESFIAGSLTFESAETQAALIELFTSEGCSSCPLADAWMSKLKASPDLWKSVVPVIFTPGGTAPKSLQVEIAWLGGNLESDV